MTESRVTLPSTVRPSSYDLTLEPNLDDFTFRGEETVVVEVREPTTSVVMNAAELEVQSCRVTLRGGEIVVPNETSFDEDAETVTFHFDSTLPAGEASLELAFTGELNDKLRGFYRSRYLDGDGVERYLATTQFEATDARRAFPCWDEPALKAVFKVGLVVPSDMAAVSNMSVASEVDEPGGLKRVEFAHSPVMSTYLLAFVVGDLGSIERRASDGTLVGVWATKGKERQGEYALDVAIRLLEYLVDYFGIAYPLDKLDHIAIPDFAAGAMENWGAITYREPAILFDPEHSSAATRQRVASIIAHELAHMWFGDLVTMEWWNDLWLNESFASWMGDKAVDHLFPEWDVWTDFISSNTNAGLALDGLKNSHPIEQEVKDPAEIGQLFDAISYAKGGAVLRMLEQFLGPETFQRGIHDYLVKHQYGNARTRDLWDALGSASDQPVAALMDSWVQQTGYPVVEVEAHRGADEIRVTARQTRFTYQHLVDPESVDETVWQVPLSVVAGATDQAAKVLMDDRTTQLTIRQPFSEVGRPWIKVNPDQTGFYRVRYSSDELANLRSGISTLGLPARDRLGVQNDTYALTKAGYLPATEFLTLAEAYSAEEDASVWDDLASNLGGLDNLLGAEPFYPQFESFAQRIFRPAGRRAGWHAKPGEGHRDALKRSTLLGELGGYGDPVTLDEAASLFAGYTDDPANVPPDLRGVVFRLAAKRGDRSTFDAIWDLQRRATFEEEKVRLLASLTSFEAADLLEETLERSLSDEVRVHETVRVVAGVMSNRHGRDQAWEFMKANWPELDRRYGEGGFAMMGLVGITSRFTTKDKMEDVQSFFEAHPIPAAERTLRQALEVMRLNIAWLELNRAALAEFFGG